MKKKLEVLYEDEKMIAVVKQPGVPSQSDRSNDEDIVSKVKNYLFDNSDSDTEPYAAIINRLDKPVGGIVLLAKDESTAAKLTDLLQKGEIKKYYQAVLSGELKDESGKYEDYMTFDKKNNMAAISAPSAKGAKKAILEYELLDEFETDNGILSYVLINLITGRHHQIRCQMAAHGTPVYGDPKYGKLKSGKQNNPKGKKAPKGARPNQRQNKEKGIALYSSRIELPHPVTGEKLILKSEPEGGAFSVIELDEF